MLTRADENFVTCDAVSAIGLWLGLGAQQPQVCAAMRLRQTHGAGPLTAGELGQVQRLLFICSVRVQGFVGAMREARVHGPGLVGAVEHFVKALVHHQGQALPTECGVSTERRPAPATYCA